MLLRKMFTRVAIATDNAGQGPIVTARDELRQYRATLFRYETRTFVTYFLSCIFILATNLPTPVSHVPRLLVRTASNVVT